MMQLAIIGLPNSGKTTLFNAISGAGRPITTYPILEIAHHSAVVPIEDRRLDALQQIFQSQKKTNVRITFIDTNGLGMSEAEGLPGVLRNRLAALDGFIYVLRSFASASAPHPLSSVDPMRDFSLLEGEFLLSDQLTVETRLERIASEIALKGRRRGEELSAERLLLERLAVILESGRPLRTTSFSENDQPLLQGFGLLSLKPVFVALNVGDDTDRPQEFPEISQASAAWTRLPAALEWEISQLPGEEQSLFLREYGIRDSVAAQMPSLAMTALNRITFFTAAEKEARAWSLPRGGSAVEAAAMVHSDMARGFIRAEVMSADELIETGSEAKMRAAGNLRLEGKNYVVQEGDLLQIRFNV